MSDFSILFCIPSFSRCLYQRDSPVEHKRSTSHLIHNMPLRHLIDIVSLTTVFGIRVVVNI